MDKIKHAIKNEELIISAKQQNFDKIKEISLKNGCYIKIRPNTSIFTDFKNIEYLCLNHVGLKEVTKEMFRNLDLTYLDLSKNQISHIEIDSFDNLNNLSSLNLSYNKLTSIKSGTFDSLTQLLYLNLSDNHINYLKGSIFRNLKNLKTLNLSSLHLIELHNTTLSGLDNLENLNLRHNDCLYGPESLTKLKNLKNLQMFYAGTVLSNRQSTIVGPENLKELRYFYTNGESPHLNWINQHKQIQVLQLVIDTIVLNPSFFNK